MGLKVGDTVRFLTAKEIEYKDKIRCGWNPAMSYLCGQTRTITRAILERIKNDSEAIWEEHIKNKKGEHETWYVSLDMIELVS